MTDFDARLRAIAHAQDRRTLWHATLDALHAEGATRVSYHATGPDLRDVHVLADGFPPDWVNEYVAQNFVKIDPIPELAARLAEPFFWHDVRELLIPTEAQNTFLDALERAKLGDGLAFYVFGPGLRNAYVGVGFDVERLELSRDVIARLQTLAQSAHLRFCALEPLEGDPSLSEREREVLSWVARGKSNSVIGSILEISPHTVDAHMRSIYRKLDVNDRTTAAIRGLGVGLLQYPDPVPT